MIFVIGGDCQGKSEFARTLQEEKNIHGEIVFNYSVFVREQLKKQNPMELVEKFLEEAKEKKIFENMIIVSEDMGCGIVPMDAFERELREVNGRVNCILAKEAKEVYRVICGIGTRIK